jgi:hypothetical protein
MGWLKKRFGEASTAAGFGLILGAANAYSVGGSQAAIAQAIAGLLAICVPEKGNK